jgi:hypothetical protein
VVLFEHGVLGQGDRDTSVDLRVHGIPSEGNTANNGGAKTREFLLVRYAAQALDIFNEHIIAREETEKDSWSVVGCASMEPTNTSYPITTHTPNVQLTLNHQLFP